MAETTTTTSILPLLQSLGITHPSLLPLLQSHRPFAAPSAASSSGTTKWLGKINTCVLAKGNDVERRSACEVASEIIRQDRAGWVLAQWGKGWLGSGLGVLSSPATALSDIVPIMELVQTIVMAAPAYPSFEREAVSPLMGKLSTTYLKLLDRSVATATREYNVIVHLLSSLNSMLCQSPASFRPAVPSLRVHLLALLLQLPVVSPDAGPSQNPAVSVSVPHEIRKLAAEVYAALHLTSGKAQSSQSWAADMRETLGGINECIREVGADAWEEEPMRIAPPPVPSSMPTLPADPQVRLSVALEMLEGWLEITLALLNHPVVRPVPVPIAMLVATGLRCLNLSLDTKTVPYITPQHRAALLTALSDIWTTGMMLLATLAQCCGDHLFPHLTAILDHSVFLLEQTPKSMRNSQAQLLRFHRVLLNLYPPALLQVEYPTRLLRVCLDRMSPLLESRSSATKGTSDQAANGESGGKRGKKRARDAEDGLVGGLEGRQRAGLSQEEVAVVLEALNLIPGLLSAPLLAPSLLAFAVRLQLAVYLSLPSATSMFPSVSAHAAVSAAVKRSLEEAMLIPDEGTARGWKTVILAVLDVSRGRWEHLLHPSAPPMLRPAPPLAALYFFAPETEEERKLRLDMGFGMTVDADIEEDVEASAERIETVSARPKHQTQPSSALRASVVPAVPPPITSAVTVGSQPILDGSALTAAEAQSTGPVFDPSKDPAAGTVNVEPISLRPASHDPLAGFGAIATSSTTTEQPLATVTETASAIVPQPVPAATAVSLSARPNPDDSDDEPLPELESDLSDFYAEDGDEGDAGEDVSM